MSVPNTFATSTTAIPLVNLDANFQYYDNAYQITSTSISFTGAVTLAAGTANGVAYLNGSKVLTTGSALTFDGTTLNVNNASGGVFAADSTGVNIFRGLAFKSSGTQFGYFLANASSGELRSYIGPSAGWGGVSTWYIDNSEQMRLTSTGLGIGTSSPSYRLHLAGNGAAAGIILQNNSTANANAAIRWQNNVGTFQAGISSYFNIADAGNIEFLNNSTTNMVLSSSGNLGIGTSSPNASAILDAQSTTKGVRMPNMTTTQKNAIASPAAGLMVFDTTLAKLCVYTGAAWQTITSI